MDLGKCTLGACIQSRARKRHPGFDLRLRGACHRRRQHSDGHYRADERESLYPQCRRRIAISHSAIVRRIGSRPYPSRIRQEAACAVHRSLGRHTLLIDFLIRVVDPIALFVSPEDSPAGSEHGIAGACCRAALLLLSQLCRLLCLVSCILLRLLCFLRGLRVHSGLLPRKSFSFGGVCGGYLDRNSLRGGGQRVIREGDVSLCIHGFVHLIRVSGCNDGQQQGAEDAQTLCTVRSHVLIFSQLARRRRDSGRKRTIRVGPYDRLRPMKILVVGAGSVGGYFGARLAQAGRDVTFLVRPGRAQQLQQKGLRIKSPHGDFSVQPRLAFSSELDGHYDVILLSVKAYALEQAMADFAAAVGRGTMILPVLNGMRQIEVLTKRFGAEPVLGGVALIVADVDQERRIVQSADIQQLTYGELEGGISSRIKTLDQALGSAGFDAQASTDITQAMWEKWVQLASLGAVTCLMRGTVGDVVAARGGAALSRAVVRECAAIATACGHAPSEGLLDWHTGLMTQAGSTLTSSMYRDMRKGTQVEAEHILGDLHQRGAERDVAAPLLEAALVNLRIYEAAQRRGN